GNGTEGDLMDSGTGLSLSTNIDDFTNGGIYTLKVSLINGQTLIKTYSFIKKGAKLYLDDFLITIEGNGEIDVKDSKNTFFTVQSDKVNAIFSFKPEDISDGTNAAKIIAEPGLLSLSLYKGIIDDVANIPQENLISKTNGLNLSANLDIKSQDGENFSFVAKIGTEYIIKVYSISRYGAKIISSEVFPTLAKAGSQVKFTITANIYNALSDIDYAQIIFDDDRFENLNLKLKESQDSGSGSNMGKEVVFEGNYNLPSDDKINGQFIGYKTFVILKDGTRTELNGKKEIYVGTRKDICKDPKTCVLRGLKALRKTNKTSFDKIIIENFNKNDFDFTEDDLYKIFRKQ
ncbi:hypothetical protein LR002_02495, partial [Candidatus Gracilibacteria bacterium]|nr:hypothetical protein [Candidatus Gracilibacteria bacterium]